MEQKHYWRKDITGLRALAVLPVLIFHAFPQWMPGGFYGVDIFFVISGYLISGIIFRGLINDSFSFADFYVKRIKRIFPNLIVLLIFVMGAGWFLLSASEYWDLGSNVSRSSLFYQNFRLMEGAGYFAGPSHANSLLHMWSLAIEEQFYLIFPLIAFLIWKIGRKSVPAMGLFVVLITIGSFVCCLMLENQNVRFYFPFSRFWELGAGICIAYAETYLRFTMSNHSRTGADVLSVVGLVMVVTALLIPTDWYAPSPGWFSLLPVLGSALLIACGAQALVNRTALSLEWVVFVGLISYSLYLWHWPLLAFLRMNFFEPAEWMLVATLILSLLVAVVVYRYVENPIRRLSATATIWVVPILILALLATYFAGKAIRKEDGFPDREIAELLAYDSDWISANQMGRYQDRKGFYVLDPKAVPEIVFLGDSHVDQYYLRARQNAEQVRKNIGFITASGCMASVGQNADAESCINAGKELQPLLSEPSLKTLVIAQKWSIYALEGSDTLERGVSAYRELIEEFLAAHPGRKVFVLLDNPWDESANQEFNMMRYIQNRLAYKDHPLHEVFVPLPKDKSWQKGNEYVLDHRIDSVTYIDTATKICPDGICNLLNYKNDDHLRSSYTRDHAAWIDQVFE